MNTQEAYNAYMVLKGLKMNEASDDTLSKLWENMITLAPIAEEMEKSEKLAKETLEDEEFKKMQERAQHMQERMSKKGVEETADDVKEAGELRKYFEEYNKKGEEFFKKIHEKAVKITLKKIKVNELMKLMKINGKTLGDLEKLQMMIEK